MIPRLYIIVKVKSLVYEGSNGHRDLTEYSQHNIVMLKKFYAHL